MCNFTGLTLCYFHLDAQLPGSVSSVVLRNYVSIVCHNATDILQQAAGLVACNYKLFEAASKIVAAEITGLYQNSAVDLISNCLFLNEC